MWLSALTAAFSLSVLLYLALQNRFALNKIILCVIKDKTRYLRDTLFVISGK